MTFVGKCAPHWRQIYPNQIWCTFLVNWQAKKKKDSAATISSIKIICPFRMQPSKAKPWYCLQMCFTEKLVCSGIRRYYVLTIPLPFHHGRRKYWFLFCEFKPGLAVPTADKWCTSCGTASKFLPLKSSLNGNCDHFTPALLKSVGDVTD